MLASVNYWRDSFQGFKELELLDNRAKFIQSSNQFFTIDFINQFFREDFPPMEEKISNNAASIIMTMIRENEGEATYSLFKDCIVSYATEIAKSSKEDWLAFIGLSDNISDQEEKFLLKLEELLKSS